MKTDISSVAPTRLGLKQVQTHADYSTSLQRIEAALDRLKTNTYGLCIACHDKIDLSRLQADPSEPHCVECAPDRKQKA